MIQAYYDLHIHSALSPCADNDMTPCDIVGMAILNNLDIIAITDHNTTVNAQAVCEAAKYISAEHDRENELIVLPGTEVSTAEEVHVVCLFDNVDNAHKFETALSRYFTPLENREDIYGEQLVIDSKDNVVGRISRMLIAATTITFESLLELTHKHDGAFIPAHVDRSSFSVISNLGFLPPIPGIATVEFTSRSIFGEENKHNYDLFPGKNIILSSDAHQLHAINERDHYIEIPEFSAKAVINYLRGY